MIDSVFKIFILTLLVSCGHDTNNKQNAGTANQAKESIQKADSIHIDTFLIKNTRFKILSKANEYAGIEVYVWKDGMWMQNLLLSYAINGYSFEEDFNQDGFNDFKNSLLRGSQVYLFDPTLMKFSKDPVYFAFDWTLLDTTRKLYANNYEIEGVFETDLFKLKGLEQIYYYTAPIEQTVKRNEETETLRVYKIINNDFNDTAFVTQKKINLLTDSFDYRKFWMGFIKKGYR